MKIIEKYYDAQGKLRTLNDKNNKIDSTIRFKILNNGRIFPCCDFNGICTNLAYAEVYPFLMKNKRKKGWSYLCKKHYFEEKERMKSMLPACLKVEW